MKFITKFKESAIFRNIVYAYIIKGAAVIIGVLLVRAYMKYFSSNSVLGIWYTILSIISWVINFDLGIGQGLRNISVKAINNKDIIGLKRLISSSYITILFLAVFIFVVGTIATFIVDWNQFFHISRDLISNRILRISILISLAGILIQMVLKLITSLLNAMEKTALTNMLTLSTNIIIVLFVVLYHGKNNACNLLALAIAYFVALILPYVLASIVAYSRELKSVRPDFLMFDKKFSGRVLLLGGKFFLAQIMLMVITVTNEAFITRLVSVDQVVIYQVYNKLFSTLLLLFSLITNPFWSAIARKWQVKEYASVKKMYKGLVASSGMWSLGVVLLCLCIQPIVNIWLGDSTIHIDAISNVIFGIYTIIMLYAYAHAAVSNALSRLKLQIICYTVAAILKYPICVLLLKFRADWSAIVLANSLIMFPYIILQPILLRNSFRKITTPKV